MNNPNIDNILTDQAEDLGANGRKVKTPNSHVRHSRMRSADGFGEEVENLGNNFQDNQDEFLNFSIKRVGKAILTGGISETKAGKKIEAKAPPARVAKAILSGGLSETKAGKKVENKAGEVAKKISNSDAFQKFKTLNLTPVRGAFLSLAAINIFGQARQLQNIKNEADLGKQASKDQWKKITDFWYKLGGNRTKFTKAIEKGSKRNPFLAKKKKSADGSEEWCSVAGVDDAAIAGWIGLATAAIAGIKTIAGKPKEMDADTEKSIDKDALAQQSRIQQGIEVESLANVPENIRDDNSQMLTSTKYLIAGGIAITIGIAAWLFFKRRK